MKILPHKELLNLDGKVAVVTGGSEGIGFGISYRLAEAGAQVVIASRSYEKSRKAADEISKAGFLAYAISTDVSVEDSVTALVDEVVSKFGKIDILVNNAGIFPFSPIADMTTELFDKVVATNLRGVFLTTKYVSKSMIEHKISGKIINISSIDSLHPSSIGLAHYDASKHGVWGFTKNAALELTPHGISVNAVAPGGIMTPGVAAMQNPGHEQEMDRFPDAPEMEVPMGRMGVPDDIAKSVLFMASPMSDYMTGTQIVVDGGYLLT